jgi:hypothetical protein
LLLLLMLSEAMFVVVTVGAVRGCSCIPTSVAVRRGGYTIRLHCQLCCCQRVQLYLHRYCWQKGGCSVRLQLHCQKEPLLSCHCCRCCQQGRLHYQRVQPLSCHRCCCCQRGQRLTCHCCCCCQRGQRHCLMEQQQKHHPQGREQQPARQKHLCCLRKMHQACTRPCHRSGLSCHRRRCMAHCWEQGQGHRDLGQGPVLGCQAGTRPCRHSGLSCHHRKCRSPRWEQGQGWVSLCQGSGSCSTGRRSLLCHTCRSR